MARRTRRTRTCHRPTRKQTATKSGQWHSVLLRTISDLLPLAQKLASKCWREFGAGVIGSSIERKSCLPHVSAKQRLGSLGVNIYWCWCRHLAVTLLTQVALVAQWIEHLTTDQKVVGSTPAGCTSVSICSIAMVRNSS